VHLLSESSVPIMISYPVGQGLVIADTITKEFINDYSGASKRFSPLFVDRLYTFATAFNPADVTAPVIIVADRTAEATGPQGAEVTFTVTANDAKDGTITPVCDYTSGSTFLIGSTTVTCTATDLSNNKATATFVVKVQGNNY
jgi:HYR domain